MTRTQIRTSVYRTQRPRRSTTHRMLIAGLWAIGLAFVLAMLVYAAGQR